MRYAYNLLALVSAFSLGAAPGYTVAFAMAASQGTADGPLQIAAPFPSETAFEMVGRVDHTESSITAYGFLSSVVGLDPSMIFTDPGSAPVATARFTYYARLERSAEPVSAGVPVINAEGALTVYFNENGGASLDAADSFFAGVPIARTEIQLQEVLQIEQPASGVIIGEGTLLQVLATPFQFDGDSYSFGRVDLVERFLYSGTPTSGDPTPTNLTASIAGHASVASGEASGASSTGTPAVEPPPEATALAGDASTADPACEGAEAWLAQAETNAVQAEAVVAIIPASATLQLLSSDEVSGAADSLTALAESQRTAAVPEVGASANSLLVTALSTYSHAVTLVERAIAEQDEVLLSQALDEIQIGNDLIARARSELAEVATTCGLEP